MGRELTERTIPAEIAGLVGVVGQLHQGGATPARSWWPGIDSRGGNVPRPVRLLEIRGDDEVSPGDEITVDGKAVGAITSAGGRPGLGRDRGAGSGPPAGGAARGGHRRRDGGHRCWPRRAPPLPHRGARALPLRDGPVRGAGRGPRRPPPRRSGRPMWPWPGAPIPTCGATIRAATEQMRRIKPGLGDAVRRRLPGRHRPPPDPAPRRPPTPPQPQPPPSAAPADGRATPPRDDDIYFGHEDRDDDIDDRPHHRGRSSGLDAPGSAGRVRRRNLRGDLRADGRRYSCSCGSDCSCWGCRVLLFVLSPFVVLIRSRGGPLR